MRAVYHISTGAYCDREDSHARTPTDPEMVDCSNVIGRFGGEVKDYVVVDVDEPSPQLLRYEDGNLVADAEKLAVMAADEAAASLSAARDAELLDKCRGKTASLAEVQELIARRSSV